METLRNNWQSIMLQRHNIWLLPIHINRGVVPGVETDIQAGNYFPAQLHFLHANKHAANFVGLLYVLIWNDSMILLNI